MVRQAHHARKIRILKRPPVHPDTSTLLSTEDFPLIPSVLRSFSAVRYIEGVEGHGSLNAILDSLFCGRYILNTLPYSIVD